MKVHTYQAIGFKYVNLHPYSEERQAGEIVELMCKAADIMEESVELQVLKGLLTAVRRRMCR